MAITLLGWSIVIDVESNRSGTRAIVKGSIRHLLPELVLYRTTYRPNLGAAMKAADGFLSKARRRGSFPL